MPGFAHARADRGARTTSGSTAAATRTRLGARELTLPMRVLAVADVYEALTSDRPYRPAMSSAQALEVIRSDVPRRLDESAFGALESVLSAEPRDLRAGRAESVLEPGTAGDERR